MLLLYTALSLQVAKPLLKVTTNLYLQNKVTGCGEYDVIKITVCSGKQINYLHSFYSLFLYASLYAPILQICSKIFKVFHLLHLSFLTLITFCLDNLILNMTSQLTKNK